ncbi:MAG: hypothetical protein ACRDV0_00445, partial [Acidimicrobiales bacterium]
TARASLTVGLGALCLAPLASVTGSVPLLGALSLVGLVALALSVLLGGAVAGDGDVGDATAGPSR